MTSVVSVTRTAKVPPGRQKSGQDGQKCHQDGKGMTRRAEVPPGQPKYHQFCVPVSANDRHVSKCCAESKGIC